MCQCLKNPLSIKHIHVIIYYMICLLCQTQWRQGARREDGSSGSPGLSPVSKLWTLSGLGPLGVLEPITLPSSSVLHHTPGQGTAASSSLCPRVPGPEPDARGMNSGQPVHPGTAPLLCLLATPCLALVPQIPTQPFRARPGPSDARTGGLPTSQEMKVQGIHCWEPTGPRPETSSGCLPLGCPTPTDPATSPSPLPRLCPPQLPPPHAWQL